MANKQVTGLTELTSVATGDEIPIYDVSAGGEVKKSTASNVLSGTTNTATSKATPVDADELGLVDSAASNVLKKLTWANLKATLKTYLTSEAFSFVTGVKDFASGILTATSPVLTTPKVVTSINDSSGNEVIKTPATASAVNEITVTNAATAGVPDISPTGDDTNISMSMQGKGTGKVLVETPYQSAQLASNFSTTSTTYVDITGLALSVVLAKTSHVRITISGRFQNNTAALYFYLQVLRDSTTVREFSLDIANVGIGDDRSFVVFDESVAPGTYTYKLQLKAQTGHTVVFIPGVMPELVIESIIA